MSKKNLIDSLDQLQQECAEVIHICSKIKKFGPTNWNPLPGVTKKSNRRLMAEELGDLTATMKTAMKFMRITDEEVLEHAKEKNERLKRFKSVNWTMD